MTIDFEPFKPINTSLYLCDNKFHVEVCALTMPANAGGHEGIHVIGGGREAAGSAEKWHSLARGHKLQGGLRTLDASEQDVACVRAMRAWCWPGTRRWAHALVGEW